MHAISYRNLKQKLQTEDLDSYVCLWYDVKNTYSYSDNNLPVLFQNLQAPQVQVVYSGDEWRMRCSEEVMDQSTACAYPANKTNQKEVKLLTDRVGVTVMVFQIEKSGSNTNRN